MTAADSSNVRPADQAREARYAEAIWEDGVASDHARYYAEKRRITAAVMAVADEERAADRAEIERLREAELDAAAHRHCLEAIAASPAPEGTTAEGIYWLTEKLAAARAAVERLDAMVAELREYAEAWDPDYGRFPLSLLNAILDKHAGEQAQGGEGRG